MRVVEIQHVAGDPVGHGGVGRGQRPLASPDLDLADRPGHGCNAAQRILRHRLLRAEQTDTNGIKEVSLATFYRLRRQVLELKSGDEASEGLSVSHWHKSQRRGHSLHRAMAENIAYRG